MAIVGAVVLLITLVALGGYFLYRSLPGNSAAAVPSDVGTSADAQSESTQMETLYIKVIGDSSDVLVRVPGGDVVTDTTMQQGQFVSFDHPRLDVTIGDPEAVEVYVNGEYQDVTGKAAGYSFTANAPQA
ncbi:RodZ domain-containing protein [Nocardiopsis sediminis]|uniref:RodZ domain-containing protein n=1 Tax=Nocardiopsis sediminis TaxID=1778267 RepID=A0ABV8FPJ8_9ACTN